MKKDQKYSFGVWTEFHLCNVSQKVKYEPWKAGFQLRTPYEQNAFLPNYQLNNVFFFFFQNGDKNQKSVKGMLDSI